MTKTGITGQLIKALSSLSLCLSLNSYADTHRNISVGISLGNPPWLYRDPVLKELRGIQLTAQKDLFAPLGLTPHIKPYENLVRLAAEIVKGTIDAGTMIRTNNITTLEVSDRLSCTQKPFGSTEAFLYTLAESPITATHELQKIAHLNIVFPRIIDISKYLLELPLARISTNKNPDEALKMLISGRAQLLASTPRTTQFWGSERDIKFKAVYKIGDITGHMCFSHASLGKETAQSYAEQLDKVITDHLVTSSPASSRDTQRPPLARENGTR